MRAKRTIALGILFLLSTFVVGQASSDDPSVENLSFEVGTDMVEFTVDSTEWVRYTYFELEGPRLVVDFHGADNLLGFLRRSVDSGTVEQVRASSFEDSKRAATRLVFDLAEATPYEIIDDGDGAVRIRFGDGVAAEARVAPRGMDYSVLEGMDARSQPPSPMPTTPKTGVVPVQTASREATLTTISGELAPGSTYWENGVLKIRTAQSSEPGEVQPSLASDETTEPSTREVLLASAGMDSFPGWVEENPPALAELLEDPGAGQEVDSTVSSAIQSLESRIQPAEEAVAEATSPADAELEYTEAESNVAEALVEVASEETPVADTSPEAEIVEAGALTPVAVAAASAKAVEAELPVGRMVEPAPVIAAENSVEVGAAEAAVMAAPTFSEIPVVAIPPLPEALLVPAVAAAPPAVAPVAASFMGQAVQAPETPQYTGEIVSLELVNVDLQQFFLLIAELSGLNVIVDEGVTGSLTLMLRDVPWDQALDLVLRNENLGYELQGNILRIATQGTLQTEEASRTALREAQALNQDLETNTYILSYTQATPVSGVVQGVLTPRGTIIVDSRRNALIVSDIPGQFEQVDSLVEFLDAPAQQVEIEARLLSATRNFSRDIGNQIGLLIGNNGQNVLTGAPGTASPFARNPTTAVGANLPLIANFPAGGYLGAVVPARGGRRHSARRDHHSRGIARYCKASVSATGRDSEQRGGDDLSGYADSCSDQRQ